MGWGGGSSSFDRNLGDMIERIHAAASARPHLILPPPPSSSLLSSSLLYVPLLDDEDDDYDLLRFFFSRGLGGIGHIEF